MNLRSKQQQSWIKKPTIRKFYKPNTGIAVDNSAKSPFNCNRKTIKDKNKDLPEEILFPTSFGTTCVTTIKMECMLVGTMYRTPRYTDFRYRQGVNLPSGLFFERKEKQPPTFSAKSTSTVNFKKTVYI